jgi:hypothetical protein
VDAPRDPDEEKNLLEKYNEYLKFFIIKQLHPIFFSRKHTPYRSAANSACIFCLEIQYYTLDKGKLPERMGAKATGLGTRQPGIGRQGCR